ncbi:hypothetical protein KW784_00245 [Candidatus Parcubacteria bacterium]|nr:hypothetical protein [Candidatus Parcubacteria bacterium]
MGLQYWFALGLTSVLGCLAVFFIARYQEYHRRLAEEREENEAEMANLIFGRLVPYINQKLGAVLWISMRASTHPRIMVVSHRKREDLDTIQIEVDCSAKQGIISISYQGSAAVLRIEDLEKAVEEVIGFMEEMVAEAV